MKKRFYFSAMVIATLALGSCSQDEVVSESPNAGPQAIEFGVYSGKAAEGRGLITDAADAPSTISTTIKTDGFGINATYTGNLEWAAAGQTVTDAPNFMSNQQVTFSNSNWTYDPLKYWPKTEDEMISFFAWAPYGADGIGHVSDKANQLTFTVQPKASDMVDFVAATQMNLNHEKGDKVTFNLKHELTRVNFTAVASEDLWDDNGTHNKTKIVIKSIMLEGFDKFSSKAVYTFDTDLTDNSDKGTWTKSSVQTDKLALDANASTNPTSYDLSNTAGNLNIWNSTSVSLNGYTEESGIEIASKDNPVGLFKDNHYLFLLPLAENDLKDGTTSEADELKVKVTFTYDIVTVDDKLTVDDKKHIATEHTQDVYLTKNTMHQGKAYNYKFKFDVHAVTVEASVANDWSTEESTNELDVPYDAVHTTTP